MSDSPKTDELLVMRNLRWDQLQNHARTLERQNAELRIALQHMLEVFAKPHNETLLEVIAAREAIRRAEG